MVDAEGLAPPKTYWHCGWFTATWAH